MREKQTYIRLIYSILGLLDYELVQLCVYIRLAFKHNDTKVSTHSKTIEKSTDFSNALIRCNDWGSYIVPNWVEELKDNAKRTSRVDVCV